VELAASRIVQSSSTQNTVEARYRDQNSRRSLLLCFALWAGIHRRPHDELDTHHQALATLKINGRRGWMVFFSTHSPLEARIAALSTRR
jgi:Zn-dependent protease with chaperone function